MKAVKVETLNNFPLSQNEENEGPDGWAFPKVGDILEINYGKGLIEAKRKAGLIPVYGSNGIVGYHDEPMTDGQTIILGRKGTVGAVHFSTGPCWPIDTTYFIHNFHGLRAKYVFYALGSLGLASLDKSSAIPGINRDDIYSQIISIPPFVEQDRIVCKVDELLAGVNSARERLAKVPGILKRFRQSVLAAACSGRLTADWRERQKDLEPAPLLLEKILKERHLEWEKNQIAEFRARGINPNDQNWKARYKEPLSSDSEDLPELPETWWWATIEQLAAPERNAITDGPFGSNLKTSHYTSSGPRVIRLQNIGEGVFINESAHVSAEHYETLAKHRVYAGDLVIAALGAKLPRAAIIPANLGPAIVKADCIRFKPDPSLTIANYLNYALNEESTRQRTASVVHGVARPRLNLGEIRAIAVPLSPLAEQHEIVRRVEALFRLADAIEARVALGAHRADRLTQAILAKAFRGELVPTEAELARREGRNFEPAAVLLSRLKEERRLLTETQPRRQTLKGRKRQTAGT